MLSSESTEIAQIKGIEDAIDGPAWSELPSPAVERIYSFLNRSDRISMCLVCRNWHQEYSSPSLWRKMTYRFLECEHETGMCPEVILARRFGIWFHHVKIVGGTLPLTTHIEPSKVMSRLKSFLEALVCQTQLLSISFKHVGRYLRFETDELKADFYRMILNFTQSQKKLQSFGIFLESMSFGFRNDREILKALFVNNYKTLRYLRIPSFPDKPSGESDFTMDDDLNFLVFMNLEVLEIDYTPMFERMMQSFYEHRNKVDMRRRKGRLKEMRLHKHYENRVNGIHPSIWKYSREVFPVLRIDLQMDSACDPRNLSAFIVPEMPLKTLDFNCIPNIAHDNEVGILLRHITSSDIRRSLEVLKISWHQATNFVPDLINLTDACTELKMLKLNLINPVVGLDTVLISWLENRPVSLHIVKIDIILFQPITQQEERIFTSFRELHERIAPLLQPLEIRLSIRTFYGT